MVIRNIQNINYNKSEFKSENFCLEVRAQLNGVCNDHMMPIIFLVKLEQKFVQFFFTFHQMCKKRNNFEERPSALIQKLDHFVTVAVRVC